METELTEEEAEELPYSQDLLRQFAGASFSSEKPPLLSLDTSCLAPSTVGEMDLSLGLSLGGCFGVESRETRLVRSSSIAALSMSPKEQDFPAPSTPLARTCSLPAQAEEEHRKRKEMQSLKRLEAKRKRSEKRSYSRSAAAAAAEVVGCRDRRDEGLDVKLKGAGASRWGSNAGGGRLAGAQTRPAGAAGAAGLRSSSSDFDGKAAEGVEVPGLSNPAEAKNNLAVLPSTADSSQNSAAVLPISPVLRSLKSLGEEDEAMKKISGGSSSIIINGSKDGEMKMMEDMPCVSTKGDGPNGKRIEGFLYKYRKGEEVRIVCVCHGSFLTPAEFIKHAGGGDVDHPLRHIVVNPYY